MAPTIIPFGPQHPVLPEPIHLDLVVEDEKVIEARPSIGFVHRGLEKLVEKKDFVEFVYVAERVCGICSFIHGQTYCQGVEEMMNIPVPPRAQYLRTIWGNSRDCIAIYFGSALLPTPWASRTYSCIHGGFARVS